MSLYLRGKIWWSQIEWKGVVLRRTTRQKTREGAEAFEAECNGPSVKFWRQVNKSGPLPSTIACTIFPEIKGTRCWPWLGGTSQGYGKTCFEGKPVNAQRMAWFLTYGNWPEACACHKCDNRPCCNPDHLFDGDARDNRLDRCAKTALRKLSLAS